MRGTTPDTENDPCIKGPRFRRPRHQLMDECISAVYDLASTGLSSHVSVTSTSDPLNPTGESVSYNILCRSCLRQVLFTPYQWVCSFQQWYIQAINKCTPEVDVLWWRLLLEFEATKLKSVRNSVQSAVLAPRLCVHHFTNGCVWYGIEAVIASEVP